MDKENKAIEVTFAPIEAVNKNDAEETEFVLIGEDGEHKKEEE